MDRTVIEITPAFRWSFSKLEAYETCKRQFFLQYLLDPPLPQQQNAFAEYGLLAHSLIEGWAKGEIDRRFLPAEYKEQYTDYVKHMFPPYPKGYAQKTYDQGLEYFKNFKGFGDNVEVISVEEKFETHIGENLFVGIADLVLRDKDTGDIIIIDHKTKSASSMKKDYGTFRKQLYVYAKYCLEKFGKFPKKIGFNMIKTQQLILEDFSEEEYHKTLDWICEMIEKIKSETNWDRMKNEGYFCDNICGVWDDCRMDTGMRGK